MKWTIGGALVALALAVAAPSYAADPMPANIIGVKIVVKDEAKAVDFYTKLGFKVGMKYNAFEHELLSENPQGPRLIMLLSDAMTTKPTPGGSSLMVNLPSVRAVAKALKDAGYPNVGEPKASPRSVGLTVKDPDGNTVEMLSAPDAAPAAK